MLTLIDRLAGKWFDWRTERMFKSDPSLAEFKFHKLEVAADGTRAVIEHASIAQLAQLADAATTLLDSYNAANYVEFDMLPRPDHGNRPIRVTVQWADRFSPAQKAQRFENELTHLMTSCQLLLDDIHACYPEGLDALEGVKDLIENIEIGVKSARRVVEYLK